MKIEMLLLDNVHITRLSDIVITFQPRVCGRKFRDASPTCAVYMCVCVLPLCPSPPHLTPKETFTFLTHSQTSSQPKHPLHPGLPWPLLPLQTILLHTHTHLQRALFQVSAAPCTSPSVKHFPSCCPLSPCSAK